MTTDIHTHVVPSSFPAALGTGPGSIEVRQQCGCGRADVWVDGKQFRTISDESWEVERRLEMMERSHIERQLLSPMPELLSYWLPLGRAIDIATHVNATLVEMVNRALGRFLALGMVPLQDSERAAAEAEKLASIPGICGIEIGTNINGVAIGDRRFDPFFETVARLGLAVFVHALRPTGVERLVGPSTLRGLVAFPCETAFAAASMITGGIARRHPSLRIAFSHGGGALAMVLPRLDRGFEVLPSLREEVQVMPSVQARRFFYDTLVFDRETLRFLIDCFGKTQLCLGTDRPFALQEEDPVAAIEGLGLSTDDAALLLSGNAARFIGRN